MLHLLQIDIGNDRCGGLLGALDQHAPVFGHGQRAVESRRLGAYVAGAAEWINVPLYLALAGEDAIIDNAATQQFAARVGAQDKTVKIYDGMHHTLEFEPEAADVFGDLAAWLTARS